MTPPLIFLIAAVIFIASIAALLVAIFTSNVALVPISLGVGVAAFVVARAMTHTDF